MQDDRLLLNSGPEVREQRLDEVQALGVDAIKLQLTWASVAPGGRLRPSGFDGSDLADYPASNWDRYDGLIRAASGRGLRVLVALAPPAPGWATRERGDTAGVDRPSPIEFARFVRAVGTRYDGSRRDAEGRELPRVNFWSIWNEPNHPQFLLPLGRRDGRLVSPHTYRGLVAAALDGLSRSGHRRDTILWGELLPIGRADTGPRNTIKPLRFLREMLCLDADERPYRGADARVRGCQRFRRLAGVSGFAYHPYTRRDGPNAPEPTEDDATIRSIERVTDLLDRAARRGRVKRRGMPIYVTEFGYQSSPPDPRQARLRSIPAYLNEAELYAWRNRRVKLWSQYGLADEPLLAGAQRYDLFQSGLRFFDERPKPGVYEAYRSPLVARVTSPGRVELWGAARGAPRGTELRVEQRLGGGAFRSLRGPAVTTGQEGYFRRSYRISRAAERSFRFTYLDGELPRSSRSAKVTPR